MELLKFSAKNNQLGTVHYK